MAINVYLNDRDEVLNVHLNESGAKGEKGDPIKIVETTVDNEGNTVIKFNDNSTVTVKRGEQGIKGDKGDNITVLGTEKNTNGDLVVKFSDGSKVTVPKGDKGEQGEVGKTGATGESAKITSQRKLDNGDTELSFNDGTKVVIPKGEKGDKGLKGDTGVMGDKGATGEASKVLSTEYDSEGNTVIKFNDGSSVTVKKGEKGDRGAKGDKGDSITVRDRVKTSTGDTKVTMSDGSEIVISKGDKGDSITVESSSLDTNGNTIIKFSDGKSITVKKGDKGEQGIKGEKGEPFKYEDFTKEQIDSLKASFNVREVTSLTGTGDVTTLYVYEGGLYFWNGTEYKKAVDLSKKVDTSSITSDENASGADKVFSVDFIKAKLKEMGAKIEKKVSEEQGKGLSTNDYTDEDKKKVGAIPANPKYTDTTYDLTPYAKTADLPKNLSELANDKGYKTEAEIRTLIESSSKLKKSVVDKLPTTGKEDLIYLVKDMKGKSGNVYLEYLWINNAFELIGSTSVDLSGYAKTTDLKKYAKKDDLKPEAFKPKIMTAVIDQSNSNPLTCITYEDDAKFMEKGSADWDDFFGSKLVLFKDGKEVRDLKDEELNSLTEADGDVMVKFPRKGLSIKTVGDKVYVSMTDNPDNVDFKYYAHTRGEERREAFYLGAYLGYEKDGKLRSVKGFEPTGSKSITDFRTIAQANGSGYEQLAFYQWTFLQAMYVLKYGNLDSQTALGKGLTNGSSYLNTGGTNGKGVDFGTANGTDQMRFQYIEDMWGNKFQWLDGIKSVGNSQMKTGTDKFSNDGASYSAHNLGFSGNVYNYPKSIQGTSELGFVIKASGGSQTTYFCDYQDVYGDRENFGCVGGGRGNGAAAGGFCFFCYFSASAAYAYLGGRLMFL